MECYNKNEIVFLDGEDSQDVLYDLTQRGFYFKREMVTNWNRTYPISFSIPREKFCPSDIGEKTKYQAFITPLNQSTYIYERESDYYLDYQQIIFGYTMAKGGWDCMRHYEFVANNCLPYFNKYESKPAYTMTNWASDLQSEANYIYNNFDNDCYDRAWKLTREFKDYAYNNLTCEEVARKMLLKL